MLKNNIEIDKYNQYNLPENARRSTCPLCSAQRKPDHRRCKVLMIDWKRAWAKCCHCGELLQLHTYKARPKDSRTGHTPGYRAQIPRTYNRPKPPTHTGELQKDVVQWFAGRGISEHTLLRARVTNADIELTHGGERRKAICFNYYRDNELVNVKYRTADKQFRLTPGAELVLYNLDYCLVSDDVVLCEGEMDALSYMEADIYNVLSVPNGATLHKSNLEYIDNCIGYFENKKCIYLSLDNDAAGHSLTTELIRRLGPERCYRIDLGTCKDANEYLLAHGPEALRSALRAAREVPIEGVVTVRDFEADLAEYFAHGMKPGYTTGIESLDRIFSVYLGHFMVLTGRPGDGKSDFIDMLCLAYYLRYGWRVAMASPESDPIATHAGKMYGKLTGEFSTPGREACGMTWYPRFLDTMADMFKYIEMNSYDLDVVLQTAEQLITRYGIKMLVIDPYNKVVLKASLGKNTNEYTTDYLNRIGDFARRHNIFVILAAHPVKPSGDERRNYEPDLYSIKGGGEFADMSSFALLVWRDHVNDLVKVKVLKAKFSHLGKNNEHIWLQWNARNGRYVDFAFQHRRADNVSGPIVDNKSRLPEPGGVSGGEADEWMFAESTEEVPF